MRGCPLPLAKLAPPPHLSKAINSSFPFFTAPIPTQPPCHPHSHPLTIHTTKPTKLFTLPSTQQQLKASSEFSSSAPTSVTAQQQQDNDDDEEESFQVLTAMKSEYNDIVIVDTPKSRMLLLDSTQGKELVLLACCGRAVSFRIVPRETDMPEIVFLFAADNVHSILYKEQKWTGSYWDEFASLPAIAPKGPIAVLGLGGGTAAHLMLYLWPSLQLDGWEIDEILIDKARDYFGLSDLEKTTEGGGILNVHIGDVFIPVENLHGRYAGIVVDLFSDGKVLPQLQEVSTWLELHKRLMPNGRFMVNCGGIDGESSAIEGITDPEILSSDETWILNPTLKALSTAFPGQLSWKRMPKESGENFMALTGPLPDLESWSARVPSPLSTNVKDWRPCGQVS